MCPVKSVTHVPGSTEPSRNHKWPKGYGSICQRCVSIEHAQQLLASAIADGEAGVAPTKLYAVCGEAVFVARTHGQAWHGYPVAGTAVPPAILARFHRAGAITDRQYRRLRSQTSPPTVCGCV